MSKNPPNGSWLPKPGDKRSSRFFFDDPDSGWKSIPKFRWLEIQRGECRVPNCAGKTFRSAMAVVEIEGRKIVGLIRVDISNWEIGVDGYADQRDQAKRSAIYANISDKPTDHADSIPTDYDIVAIKRCLGLGDG